MRWPWQKKAPAADPIERHFQRRLVEMVDALKTSDEHASPPHLERIIALFLELGHLYRETGRERDEAQVKAQAAKFMMVLPPRQEIDRLAMAQQLLREAIAVFAESDAGSSRLADARIVLAEYLSRESAETEGETRDRLLNEAETELRAALDILVAHQPAEPDAATKTLMADLFNKLGNLAKSRSMGQTAGRRDHLKQARDFFAQAAAVCPADVSPDMFALTENNLGSTQIMLLGNRADEPGLNVAREHFSAALAAIDRTSQPHLHAMVHSNLGELALSLMKVKTGSSYDLLQSAMSHFGEALPAFPAAKFPQQYAKILFGQGRALARMGQKDEARRLLSEALDYREYLPDDGAQIEDALGEL
jgi:tetratricopeptide (TPR) repeat protein